MWDQESEWMKINTQQNRTETFDHSCFSCYVTLGTYILKFVKLFSWNNLIITVLTKICHQDSFFREETNNYKKWTHAPHAVWNFPAFEFASVTLATYKYSPPSLLPFLPVACSLVNCTLNILLHQLYFIRAYPPLKMNPVAMICSFVHSSILNYLVKIWY